MSNFTRASRVLAVAVVAACVSCAFAQATQPADPLASFTRDWRDPTRWPDGRVEVARYDATRRLDGELRRYSERVLTNREFADPVTKVKSVAGDPVKDREVFRQLIREEFAAQGGATCRSTMVFVGASDLKSLKIETSTQDDAGSAFKQFVNHKGVFEWHQFSPLPGAGHKTATGPTPAGLVYEDALSFVLRGYPFEGPRAITVRLLPDQSAAGWTPTEPEDYVIEYVGRETLDLPIGKIDSHQLKVSPASSDSRSPTMRYWFAADTAPLLLHVLTRFDGPDGVSLRLRSLRRE